MKFLNEIIENDKTIQKEGKSKLLNELIEWISNYWIKNILLNKYVIIA